MGNFANGDYKSLKRRHSQKPITCKHQIANRTNSTFGFCQRSKPTHEKPNEQFLANASLKPKRKM